MNFKQSASLFVLLIVSLTIFVQAATAQQTAEVRFSVTVLDQTLENVLADIAQTTGLTLVVDSDIKSAPFPGVYNNVTVCEFFLYAVRENNLNVSVDSEQNMIAVSKIRPSQGSHGASLACAMEYTSQAQHSDNTPSNNEIRDPETDQTDRMTGTVWPEAEEQLRPSDPESESSPFPQEELLAREADYILKAKQSVKPPTADELEALHTDPQTGKPWDEIDQAVVESQKQESAGRTLSEAEFLAAESDYIHQAKQSVKPPTDRELEALHTDPQTGKPWHEIDQAILESQKQNRASRKFSEAEFLADESDYIEHAKSAINHTLNGSSD